MTAIKQYGLIGAAERCRSRYSGEDYVLYRIVAQRYSYVIDADREEYGTTAPQLEIRAYRVVKWTEHGATLDVWSGARRKWVDLRPTRAVQWASRTPEDALEHYRKRKEWRVHYIERDLRKARAELSLADQNYEK